MKVNRGLRFPKVMFKIVCRLDYMPALPPRCCIAFSRQKHAIPRKGNNCKPPLAACVSPYLLCKPNLDDTHEISARTIHKKVI